MREIMVVFPLDDGKALIFDGRDLMIVPLSEAERLELGQVMNGVSEFLTFSVKCLATLKQVIETKQDPAAQVAEIAKTRDQRLSPSRTACELHERCRERIGRAVFVGQSPENRRMN
jgi:hypothetical protein